MTFSEYCEQVKNYGYFSIELGDNRSQLGITDEACELVLNKWLIPLFGCCEKVFVYRIIFKDRSYDVTPPPRTPKPIFLEKTPTRVELDAKAMLTDQYRRYWAWALRHATIVLCIPEKRFPIDGLATECWDPGILMNPGAIVAAAPLQLARREVKEQRTCCVFSRDSYSIGVHIFAPKIPLLKFYKCCVMNCRFILKGLERELKPARQRVK